MAIVTPPAPLPLRNAKWRIQDPAQVNRSAWTGRRKVLGLPGASIWTLTAEFRTFVTEKSAKKWKAFFVGLRGPANRFPVNATENVQTAAANPTVRLTGANAGTTIPLQGLTPSATVLETGDMMSVPLPSGHVALVCLQADLVTNSSGQGTATFAPELGQIPAAGVTVEIKRPYALMALTSEPPGWDVAPGQTYSFALSAEEAK